MQNLRALPLYDPTKPAIALKQSEGVTGNADTRLEGIVLEHIVENIWQPRSGRHGSQVEANMHMHVT